MFLIPSAHAQSAAPAAGGDPLISFGFMIGIFVLFYFIAIRPQRKRQKEINTMLSALTAGDEVSTNAGILGKVKKIEGDYVVVKVADNVDLKFQKAAILAVLPKGTLKAIE